MEVAAEVEIDEAPSSSKDLTEIWVNDGHFDKAIDEWRRLTSGINEDDMNLGCLPNVTGRNASAEPAAESDFSSFEAKVLMTEDRLNDIALRAIAPIDCCDFNWEPDKQAFTGQRETFTGTPGPTFPVTDQTTAVDVFNKMIDSDFLDKLCTETNRFASQKIALLRSLNKLPPNSRLHRWTPTDRGEMVSFLTIIILQGLYPLPAEENYFSFNGFGTMPYFSEIMSYNRFILLNSMLHFVDSEILTEPAKLCKIQCFIDYFNEKFSSLYYPCQEIVIDESLHKWHGRLGFAQKILSRAAQIGLKTYELCESSSGYLWKFFVYAGKDKPTATVDTNAVDKNETTDGPATGGSGACPSKATVEIVYDLIEPLLYRGHTLILDHFYNSPLLARNLKTQQTDCYGTLRLNREFVPDSLKTLTKTELSKGETVAAYCSDLSLMVWRDANLVSMLSTYHDLQDVTVQKYNRRKPNIVLDYNKSMEGVDKKVQFLSAQPMERAKCKDIDKKIFRRLFNAAVFNCYVIYSTANPKLSHRLFRTMLAENLLMIHKNIDLTTESRLITTGAGMTETARPRRKHAKGPQLEHRHFPVRSKLLKARCWMCSQRKVGARTVWKCMECNVSLCIDGCFMAYHT